MHTKIEGVAKALIFDNEGNVLVLRLGEHKVQPHKSYTPDLPGGIVDSGESYHEAVARETAEETGLVIEPRQFTLIYADTSLEGSSSVTKTLFIATSEKTDVTLSWEHSEFEWIPVNDLSAAQLRPFYSDAIQYARTNGLF